MLKDLENHRKTRLEPARTFRPGRKRVLINKLSFTLYAVGWLGVLTNRTSRTVRSWESKHILPKPIFDLRDGRRWYCAAELVGYSKMVRESGMHCGSSATELRNAMGEFHIKLRMAIKMDMSRAMDHLPNEVDLDKHYDKVRGDALRNHAFDILREPGRAPLAHSSLTPGYGHQKNAKLKLAKAPKKS